MNAVVAGRWRPNPVAAVFALILVGAGLVLLAGGVRLLGLGGSPYYAVAGVILMMVGALLWRGGKAAVCLYSLFLLVTWGWALWETGGDSWALVPRVALLSGLALVFLLPPIVRHSGWEEYQRQALRGLLVMGAVLVLVVGAIMVARPGMPRSASGGGMAVSRAVPTEWRNWGGDPGGSRFVEAGQITPANVAGLKLAWTYKTGAAPRPGGAPALAFEVTPLKIGNRLYGCTPHNVLFALDAVSGREIWHHDPKTDDRGLAFANCRGVAYADLAERGMVAAVEAGGAGRACVRRIYTGTIDARLLAVDADSGAPCTGFGDDGAVDMRRNIGPHERMYYYYTAAPTVSGKVVVIGSYGFDGQKLRQPSGVIRAYDLRTGQQVWDFDPADPDRRASLADDEIYEPGTPNSWTVSSTDERFGLVYVPLGVATPDYYGGERSPAAEKYSNAIVALDSHSGAVRWFFQTVHHDIWDYDVATQPVLADFRVDGRRVPALISISKTGEMFVLDRRTGKPLSRVEEKRVPQGGAPGEHMSPTQPFSVDMPDFAGRRLTEAEMWGLTPFDQLWCRLEFRSLRYEGRYTPPSLQGSLQYPGFAGGVNWGGYSVDRDRNIVIVNSNRLPTKSRLITPEDAVERGMEPAGAGVKSSPEAVRAGVPQLGARYAVLNGTLMSPLQVPCLQPPVGEISAVDLDTRSVLWRRPIGTADRMGPLGIASHLPLSFGLPTVGGPLTTRGGVTFIASTPDRRIRAFETRSGRLLWQADLPANGNANPMSYVGEDGRQYVVVAAGGSAALASNDANILIAFVLPAKP